MRSCIIAAAVFMAALMPFSVSRAAEDLESRLNQLDAELGRQGEIIREQQKTIETLREELARQEEPQPQPQQALGGSSPTSKEGSFFGGSALTNPSLSLVVDTFAYVSELEDDKLEARGIPGFTSEGPEQRQGFNLRAAELVLFAPVDPYFNLYANLPVTEEGIELEEAYAVTTALPAGWQVKGGKFKSNFSRLSAQHPHAWDFADIALPYRAFLGEEGMGGEKGVQLTYLPALPFFLQMGGEVLQGQNALLFGEEAASGPHAFSIFAKGSVDTGEHSTLHAGPFVLFGQTRSEAIIEEAEVDGKSELYGLEAAWKWQPASRRGLTLQGEYLYLRQRGNLSDASAAAIERLTRRQDGFYLQGIWRQDRWRFGGRYDALELLADTFEVAGVQRKRGETPWRATASLEFNPSEFTRIRLQYSHDDSGRDGRDNDECFLQFIFGIGAHAAHAF
ncbi:MAG TPA: hypothetical protein VD811_09505 [Desulfuromonadales bacterium]|nr:hypothetical protein [Desulfuromonadales bacterium]